METINLHAAKTQFSRLVDEASAGREVIIAKAGKPVAKLGPLAPLGRERVAAASPRPVRPVARRPGDGRAGDALYVRRAARGLFPARSVDLNPW